MAPVLPVVVLTAVAAVGCATTPANPHPAAASPAAGTAASAPTVPTLSPTPVRHAPRRTHVAAVPTYASPDRLAVALRQAQRVLDSAGADATRVAAAARAQQAAYRQLVVTPGWRAAVLARLPAALRATARDTIDAGTALRGITAAQPALPRWRIVRPAPPDVLLGYYREARAATGIDWTYLAAVNFVETKFGRLRGTSVAGAQGPMQFMPSTWAAVGRGDVNDPRDAIMAAARYLVQRGGPRDMDRALYGYNPTTHYVDGVTRYAQVMQRDPRAFYGYYYWQVVYRYVRGDVYLLEGYDGTRRTAP